MCSSLNTLNEVTGTSIDTDTTCNKEQRDIKACACIINLHDTPLLSPISVIHTSAKMMKTFCATFISPPLLLLCAVVIVVIVKNLSFSSNRNKREQLLINKN